MKKCKKQGLTLLLIAAFVISITLAVAIPSQRVNADTPEAEEPIVYTNTVRVSTEEGLKNAVKEAGETHTEIILENNIEMNSISSSSKPGKRFYDITVDRKQVIKLDLAGHILSTAPMSHGTRPVIYNYGTLSIVDSSGNYSGAVVSNGYIEQQSDGYYWDASKNVIENYGALTVDANLRMNCPKATPSGTNGYFQYGGGGTNVQTKIDDIHLIYNYFETPKSEDLIYPTSLTINGGNFDLAFSNYYSFFLPPIEHFFYIGSTDLTINGGTFRNSSSRTPYYEGGFLADIQAVTSIGDYKSFLKDVLHMDIKITGGDFGDKNLLNGDNEFVYVDEFAQKREGYDEYEISISGGTFPLDLSAYTDAEHMMQAKDDGTYSVVTIDDDYIREYAVAKSMLDDDESTLIGYYGSFESAWNAAQTRAQMGQSVTIQLLKNAESNSLVLEHSASNASIIFDLNGHTLNMTQDDTYTAHVQVTTIWAPTTGVRTLVIRDTSENQDGTFNLVYLKDAEKGGFHLNDEVHFVLESGTVTRTGGGFKRAPDGGVFGSASARDKSIFHLSSLDSCSGAVTIKGGNILSKLDGDDQGYLITYNDAQYDHAEDFALELYRECITLDFDAYLPENVPGKGCQFSWDLRSILPQNFKCAEDTNTHIFYVTRVGTEKYLVGIESFNTLSEAIAKAKEGTDHTILMVAPDELQEGITLDGVTLDLNIYQHFTLIAPTVTLNGDAMIMNGAIQGDVVVEGPASFENFELHGGLTVKSTAELDITAGTYDGTVDIESGAKLTISGGSFKGSEIDTIEPYFLNDLYGAFKPATEKYEDDKAYSVMIAPNTEKQAWYDKFIVENRDESGAYIINNATDWNNFALFVSSGADVFSGKMIKLGASIDFAAQNARAVSAFDDAGVNFLPAGTNAHRFAGSFDGQNNTMSGIIACEQNVGLFGAAAYGSYVRVMNITVKDSSFMIGSGLLDSYNSAATPSAGAIIGEGHLDMGRNDDQWSGNITLSGVTVGAKVPTWSQYVGGVVGHSWGSIYLDGLKIQNKTTIKTTFKAGGVVGYLEGTFYIKKADIKQGVKEDGSDNGLILEGGSFAGALVGHANGSSNTIEDCTILEHNDSLIGSTYAGGAKSKITIKGSETELDIYRVVGEGRSPASETVIELSGEISEDGIYNGSIKTREDEDYLKFQDGEGNPVEVEKNPEGGVTAKSELTIKVTIGNIQGTMTYGDTLSIVVTSFTLFDEFGHPLNEKLTTGLTVEVSLEASQYYVGTEKALIISYKVSGENVENFEFERIGNQTFMEINVQPRTLYVTAKEDGTVDYTGFAKGDDVTSLGGALRLDRVDNGDGTVTVMPAGYESDNYNIVYAGYVTANGTVSDPNPTNDLLLPMIILGAILLALGACAVVYIVRRKRN